MLFFSFLLALDNLINFNSKLANLLVLLFSKLFNVILTSNKQFKFPSHTHTHTHKDEKKINVQILTYFGICVCRCIYVPLKIILWRVHAVVVVVVLVTVFVAFLIHFSCSKKSFGYFFLLFFSKFNIFF